MISHLANQTPSVCIIDIAIGHSQGCRQALVPDQFILALALKTATSEFINTATSDTRINTNISVEGEVVLAFFTASICVLLTVECADALPLL